MPGAEAPGSCPRLPLFGKGDSVNATYRRLTLCGIIAALIGCSIALPAMAQKPMKLKFTSPLAPPPFLVSETSKWWADEVAK